MTYLEAIEIISHGSEGTIQLGKSVLSNDSLSEYSSQLQQWGKALREEADILLYGCNVAANETGTQFIQRLSELTGVDIAASEDLTGNSDLGGDWDLEATTGDIESETAISSEAQQEFASVLPVTAEYYNQKRGKRTNHGTLV